MVRNQGRQSSQHVVVTVRHVAAPDAKQRLSRVVNILLTASTLTEEEKLPRQGHREEGLIGGKLSEAAKSE